VSVVFVGDAEIRDLHRRFLGEDSATDVLAFDLGEPGGRGDPHPGDLLGEIVVSVETAAREAARRGEPLERELALYALHGLLHLLGLDDSDPGSRRRMRRAEARHLALWDEAPG
jgi:probable rRNA maturation factor